MKIIYVNCGVKKQWCIAVLRIVSCSITLSESGFRNPAIFTVKSGILVFGIRNTAQGNVNPTNN